MVVLRGVSRSLFCVVVAKLLFRFQWISCRCTLRYNWRQSETERDNLDRMIYSVKGNIPENKLKLTDGFM